MMLNPWSWLLASLLLASYAMPSPFPTLTGARPMVIGHRGASGLRPEHTLESYRQAIADGADFIEPDLVMTRDGVLVARHENEISATTDVADRPAFADRKTSKRIDGELVSGWFTEDFTLAELKTLRARERIPQLRPGNTVYNDRYEIPTFQEIIELARRESAATGRVIGLYPETKHPTYFRAIGLPLEEPLVAALHANGYRGPAAPVFIQSFEVGNLKRLRALTELPLTQLLGADGQPYDFVVAHDPRRYADLLTPAGLAEIDDYAQAIGPNKDLIIPRDAAGRLLPPTTLTADAHRFKLQVHPWTFRSENYFLPADFRRGDGPTGHGAAIAEIRAFLALGVDGFFTDFPAVGVAAAAVSKPLSGAGAGPGAANSNRTPTPL